MTEERIKVLYVDDEEGNLQAFRATFRRDFEVHTALDARTALGILEQHAIHVVVSDQRMPGMTGSEFLSQVRMQWPRTVRFLLTGYSDIEAVISAVNDGGIHAYVTKPWDPVDLKLRIEQAHEMHALRDERERLYMRYRQVFEDSGDPIVIMDHNGTIREANGAAQRLVGMDRAALCAGTAQALVQDLPGVIRNMRRCRTGTSFANVDVTLRTSTGDVIDCLMTLTYLSKRDKSSGQFQAVLKDISDRRKEELRLQKLNSALDKRVSARTKQLMEAMEDLGAFSYSVAHDLRSPLKNIRALAEHMTNLAALRGDDEEKDLSSRIHRGSTRLISLVDDLLRFARTDTQELHRETVDLRELLDECLREIPLENPATRIIAPLPGAALLHADKAMVRVVLNNLLNNALKFTRPSEQPVIEVGFGTVDDHHTLWVKDNGVGFDPAKSEQIFGVFKRLHRSEQFEGTGIGLAIVQRIMQKHGGSCSAASVPGEGATFQLQFPINPEEKRFLLAG